MSNINKNNKINLPPIKDISKSLLKITWFKNPVLNRDFFPLQPCKKNNFNTEKISNIQINNNFKKRLEILDNSLNMTIQNILNNMSDKRKQNNYSNIRHSLDKNKYFNKTENRIIPYSKTINKKQALDELLLSINSIMIIFLINVLYLIIIVNLIKRKLIDFLRKKKNYYFILL